MKTGDPVSVPTLFIAGGADRLREPGYEQAMCCIPDVEIHVIRAHGIS
jgi:hypothetical protein